MTRRDMIAFLVCFCDSWDDCNTCPGKKYCIGFATESEIIGASTFSLMTDAEVRDMYFKCGAIIRSEGVDNDYTRNHQGTH